MLPEWSEYILQSKRSHMLMPTSNGHIFANYPPLFDYSVIGLGLSTATTAGTAQCK